jgi:hypothetical protein
MKKYTILFGAVCAVILAFSLNAKAGIIEEFTSSLDTGNSAISGFPGPYGMVTVTLSGQVATITFTSNTAGGFMFIDHAAAAVEVNSTSFTEAIGTDTQFKEFGSGNVDGFGDFNLFVTNKDGSASAVSTISFTVTNTDLSNLWGSASDVLTNNANGFDAAAHISVNGGVATGYAGENGGNGHVPDSGATAMLLGSALAGLGVMRRYLKR